MKWIPASLRNTHPRANAGETRKQKPKLEQRESDVPVYGKEKEKGKKKEME